MFMEGSSCNGTMKDQVFTSSGYTQAGSFSMVLKPAPSQKKNYGILLFIEIYGWKREGCSIWTSHCKIL